MNFKLLGGILLVVGTTIGAGMLALPIATAQVGFWGSLFLLVFCWAIMTASAFIFLEVTLWLPPNTNLISMAGMTLGRTGQAITWVVYLLLLYSILSAYIAGGGDLFHYLLTSSGNAVPLWVGDLLFTFTFGAVVYFGIRSVDYVNRALMTGKLGALVLLVGLILPFVKESNLSNGTLSRIASPTSLTITALSFGCVIIIPSLRNYFGDDIRSLRKAILYGTLIPLFCYAAWDMVIMGVIPIEGKNGLGAMLHSPSSNSDLVSSLTGLVQKDSVTVLAKFFTSICMATSFLSISLCLSDFLADGLKIKKEGRGGWLIYAITFLPAIGVVLLYPDAFIRGLNYAGISCLILMVLLPPLMAWRGRYHHALANQDFKMIGGKPLLIGIVMFAVILIGFGMEGAI